MLCLRVIEEERSRQVRERSAILTVGERKPRDRKAERKRAEGLMTIVACAVGVSQDTESIRATLFGMSLSEQGLMGHDLSVARRLNITDDWMRNCMPEEIYSPSVSCRTRVSGCPLWWESRAYVTFFVATML